MVTGHLGITKTANGNILRGPNAVMERWGQYFEQTFNEEFPHPPIPFVKSVQAPVLPVAPVEVSEAIRRMKPNKATGPDDIPTGNW
ncbi:hypothetical protein Y032_0155g3082 [Ancylostoma ceylanicum]|nr:hypothetical protein Y032_0155g3082 [Ancylostoma ceylanicum]